MPNSFLSRHRTICDTIAEIKQTVVALSDDPDLTSKVEELCNEASSYAQRMSAKLAEYKNGQTKPTN